MDLTSTVLDTTSLGAAGLILVGGLAVLWGIKRVLSLFEDNRRISRDAQARADYQFRSKYYGAHGGLDPATYRGRVSWKKF